MRRRSFGAHPHPPLTVWQHITRKRFLHGSEAARPAPGHDEVIRFGHPAGAEGFVDGKQGGPVLGDHKATRSAPVEPMGELQTGPRPGGAQRLDHPAGDAAAPMHGNAGGLGQHDEPRIFVNHARFELGHQAFSRRTAAGLEGAMRWYAHHVAGGQARMGPGAAAVDAHFALAHHRIDAAARHTLQVPRQEVVQALAGMVNHGVMRDRHGATIRQRVRLSMRDARCRRRV